MAKRWVAENVEPLGTHGKSANTFRLFSIDCICVSVFHKEDLGCRIRILRKPSFKCRPEWQWQQILCKKSKEPAPPTLPPNLSPLSSLKNINLAFTSLAQWIDSHTISVAGSSHSGWCGKQPIYVFLSHDVSVFPLTSTLPNNLWEEILKWGLTTMKEYKPQQTLSPLRHWWRATAAGEGNTSQVQTIKGSGGGEG